MIAPKLNSVRYNTGAFTKTFRFCSIQSLCHCQIKLVEKHVNTQYLLVNIGNILNFTRYFSNMNDDPSDSEEEILVYAEFKDSVKIEKYRNIHVLGIDKKTPIIQMDDTFFTGNYENPLGTYLFFEEDPSPQCADPLFDKLPEKNLKYLFKTTKLLTMEHAYVAPKEGTDTNILSETQQPDRGDNIDPVTFNTLQEALDTFKRDWDENVDGDNKPEVEPHE